MDSTFAATDNGSSTINVNSFHAGNIQTSAGSHADLLWEVCSLLWCKQLAEMSALSLYVVLHVGRGQPLLTDTLY